MAKKQLNVLVDEGLKEAVSARASMEGRSQGAVVSEALRAFLDAPQTDRIDDLERRIERLEGMAGGY